MATHPSANRASESPWRRLLRPAHAQFVTDAADREIDVVGTGQGREQPIRLLKVAQFIEADGLIGVEDEVRARGGRVLAEAESSCTVYGMPRAIVEARLADVVVPLGELAEAIAVETGS